MHPILLTFDDAAIEGEYCNGQQKATHKAERFMTRLSLVATAVLLCLSESSRRTLAEIVLRVALGGCLYYLNCQRKVVLERRIDLEASWVKLMGLHLGWVIVFEALLRRSIPIELVAAQAILVQSGAWVALTWMSSPLPSRYCIPFQLCITLSVFWMRPLVYAEEDAFTQGLHKIWDEVCVWNGFWLNGGGVMIPCPDPSNQSKAIRSHLFVSIVLGFILPGLLCWIWEAKHRQRFHKTQSCEAQTESCDDFVPISYTVALTFVSISLLWLLISTWDGSGLSLLASRLDG